MLCELQGCNHIVIASKKPFQLCVCVCVCVCVPLLPLSSSQCSSIPPLPPHTHTRVFVVLNCACTRTHGRAWKCTRTPNCLHSGSIDVHSASNGKKRTSRLLDVAGLWVMRYDLMLFVLNTLPLSCVWTLLWHCSCLWINGNIKLPCKQCSHV